MKKLKYIITKDGSPILFGNATKHNELFPKSAIRSAGFVSIDYDREADKYIATCYGESESLGIKSMPEQDKSSIERMIDRYSF